MPFQNNCWSPVQMSPMVFASIFLHYTPILQNNPGPMFMQTTPIRQNNTVSIFKHSTPIQEDTSDPAVPIEYSPINQVSSQQSQVSSQQSQIYSQKSQVSSQQPQDSPPSDLLNNEEVICKNVQVPYYVVGKLLGSKGKNLQYIRYYSDCRIYVHKDLLNECKDANVEIEGRPNNVQLASKIIGNLVNKCALMNVEIHNSRPRTYVSELEILELILDTIVFGN